MRLTSLCRTLYSVTEPCCSLLGYTRVCSMVYGRVKGPASATNNTAVMHKTFGIWGGKNVSWVYFLIITSVKRNFIGTHAAAKFHPTSKTYTHNQPNKGNAISYSANTQRCHVSVVSVWLFPTLALLFHVFHVFRVRHASVPLYP